MIGIKGNGRKYVYKSISEKGVIWDSDESIDFNEGEKGRVKFIFKVADGHIYPLVGYKWVEGRGKDRSEDQEEDYYLLQMLGSFSNSIRMDLKKMNLFIGKDNIYDPDYKSDPSLSIFIEKEVDFLYNDNIKDVD